MDRVEDSKCDWAEPPIPRNLRRHLLVTVEEHELAPLALVSVRVSKGVRVKGEGEGEGEGGGRG